MSQLVASCAALRAKWNVALMVALLAWGMEKVNEGGGAVIVAAKPRPADCLTGRCVEPEGVTVVVLR